MPFFHYRLVLAYKGTHFFGWQAQTPPCDTPEDLPTVQGTIVRILRRMTRFKPCSVSGTSRTDAGVHAQGQLVKVRISKEIAPKHLMRGLNTMLPASIRILSCEACASSFNVKTGIIEKEYRYYFSDAKVLSPLVAELVAQVPGPLNTKRLHQAASCFEGKHDFYNFCKGANKAASTVRTISHCSFVEGSNQPMQPAHCIRVIGDGFLKQGVRYIASAIFEVARGNVSLETLQEALRSPSTEQLCKPALPHGLHLVHVSKA